MLVFVGGLFSGLFTPSAPASWSRVHIGMSRSDALEILGPPQESGWPEKIVETWRVKSPLCSRTLYLSYGESNLVGHFTEYSWVRGCEWTLSKRIDK
jgi:hypothetical protein